MLLEVVLQSFFLFSVASAACRNDLTCQLTNGTRVVLGRHSICCNGQIIPKVQDDTRQRCCCDSLPNGTQEVFNLDQEICCEGNKFPKNDNLGQERVCCGTTPYVQESGNLCCFPHISRQEIETTHLYTSLVGRNDTCCGNEKYDPATKVCCTDDNFEVRLYPRDQTKECCQRDYISKATHECQMSEETGRLTSMLKFIRPCGNVEIDTREDLCCNGKPHRNVLHISSFSCCGDETFNINTHHCCNNIFPIARNMQCCGSHPDGRCIIVSCCGSHPDGRCIIVSCCGSYPDGRCIIVSCCGSHPDGRCIIVSCCGSHTDGRCIIVSCCGSHPDGFNPRTQRCCNETLVEISHGTDQCCGTVTMDARTHVCCNDQAYDKSTVKFCKDSDNKCSAVGIQDSCCGSKKLNQRYVCCKAGTNYDYNYFQTLKKKSSDNSCCTSYIKGSTSAVPYSDQTEECRQGHKPTVTRKLNQPKCGRTYFDKNTDLCCNNKLYRGGLTAGQRCCQYNVFNPATQSCCVRGRVYNSTSCPNERCGNRSFDTATQLCCHGKRYHKQSGRVCCGKHLYNPSKQTCCGSKVATNPNQCRKPEHPICEWLCEQEDKKIRRQIRIGKIDICKTNAYITRIGRKNNIGDVTRIQLEGEKNRLYHHNQNSFRVKKLFHPTCVCDRAPRTEVRRKIVVITDKSIRDTQVDLTDSDYILPYTAKIRKTLMKYWKERCNTPTSLVTADVVDEIFDFIKVKIEKQKKSRFYES
ncbi:uncharacterized protein LOC110453455 isoform X2 [Mizuhopecten yessoensis]|uniref:uncharacterized protein LOC110453455 isoform X2 n=1 Tax=Mizuhopecten yessoensis TaxID=6573 RepID=UPI000B45A5C7|nr:uncharacterized protein LOC110453455 isoform X2 [Mizuhopecten yessoensis]